MPAALTANGLLLAVAISATLPSSLVLCRAGSGHVALESAFAACCGPAPGGARCDGVVAPAVTLSDAPASVAPQPCVDTALATPALAARAGHGAASLSVPHPAALAPASFRPPGAVERRPAERPLPPPHALASLRTTVLTI